MLNIALFGTKYFVPKIFTNFYFTCLRTILPSESAMPEAFLLNLNSRMEQQSSVGDKMAMFETNIIQVFE